MTHHDEGYDPITKGRRTFASTQLEEGATFDDGSIERLRRASLSADPLEETTPYGSGSPIDAYGDRIIVEVGPDAKGRTTAHGLYIPAGHEQEQLLDTQKGRVVSVGKGRMSEAGQLIVPQVRVGQVIWFHRYGTTSLAQRQPDGTTRDFVAVREMDIVGTESTAAAIDIDGDDVEEIQGIPA